MARFHRTTCLSVVGAVCLSLVTGCGTSEKKLVAAEKRIEALALRGAPESLLSKARIFIFNARTANQMGKPGESKANGDSLMTVLAQIEEQYQTTVSNVKPFVDSLVASLVQRKKGLTGCQLRTADSAMVFVDSLVTAAAYSQAKDKVLEIDTLMAQLIADEAKAAATRPKVIGTWTSREKSDFGGVETRKFVLKPDGSVEINEEKKGQTDQYRKEDWKFASSGTFVMKGDTVVINITKEKCERQMYWNFKNNAWVKNPAPTYDTTYTRHEKDRYMTYEYMTTYLKKAK